MDVLDLCRQENVEAVLPEQEVEKYSLEDVSNLAQVVADLGDEQVDFCIAIGGDGTILRAFSRFRDMQTPILGINYGNVGFLSAIDPEGVTEALRLCLRGDYELLQLSLLELVNGAERYLSLNDVVIHKPDGGSVIRLAYQVGELELDEFNCDGMVISTPAGSTAYNLSIGGPLVSLALDAAIVTAIAPHTLSARSLVLAPGQLLTVWNRSPGSPAAIYLDGRHCCDMGPGKAVTVTLAEEKAKLVQLPGADIFLKLRDKFIRPG